MVVWEQDLEDQERWVVVVFPVGWVLEDPVEWDPVVPPVWVVLEVAWVVEWEVVWAVVVVEIWVVAVV